MSNFRLHPLVLSVKHRKQLDPSLHSSIDAFLKSLKPTCRRLQVASTTLGNEEQLLQRLYYKGKNQHRSALFWRRTTELRRYCERVRSLTLSDTFTRMRCSFFGETALSNQNLLKGSWNSFPDAQSLSRSLDYIVQAQALLTKFHTKTMDAYGSFSTSMQTGAFVQILLVLAAISARMNSIAQEYLEILSGLQQSIRQVHTATTTLIAQDVQPSPVHLPKSDGSSLTSNDTSQNDLKVLISENLAKDVGDETCNPPPQMMMSNKVRSSTSSAPVEKQTKTLPKTKREQPLKVGREKSSTIKEHHKPRLAKEKKRKRDEIDEIFGF